ncbi:DUF389 domain-containing protein [Robertkochia sediminum]|uniref:DUF389 domain-containing protein n=1 Tax=Robertkochia sediminum TaxID=2785326 RepID=UPI0019341846|nr:DUF389 domain-containing protein [Robertkochia sediminum]MBL7472853.1 DUF389 domain-containing protein [Robertkochia sediminum]
MVENNKDVTPENNDDQKPVVSGAAATPEEQEQEAKRKEDEKKVKKDVGTAFDSLRAFLKDLLNIRDNTDVESTREGIINDIPFKGHTAWILICSIFIASVGLNANSTAVVIGAMLISPLMGPILGVGFSVAINDVDLLRRSLKNFGVMVVLSVVTAFFFFKFFPLQDENSELLARTAPDVRDVLIAFFGGLALVIARAKKGTIASVIFGVAIATALMPPLCTVGFGLAIWNLEYAIGASYLFTINAIFIGIATFLVVKYLRFPMVRYANSKKRRRIGQIASIVAILVTLPAIYTFYAVWKKSVFERQASEFYMENVSPYQFSEGGFFLNDYPNAEYNDGENSVVEVVIMGDESVPDNVVETWKAQMKSYPYLKDATLNIKGGRNGDADKYQYVTELYEAKKEEIATKDQRIGVLEGEVERLRRFAYNDVPFSDISKELRINYSGIEQVGFANEIITDFKKTDTIPIFYISWSNKLSQRVIKENTTKIHEWLQVRTGNQKVQARFVRQAEMAP